MALSTGLGGGLFRTTLFSKCRKQNPTLYINSNNYLAPSSTDAGNAVLEDFLFDEPPHTAATNTDGMGFFGL